MRGLALVLTVAAVGVFSQAAQLRAVIANWASTPLEIVQQNARGYWSNFDEMHQHYTTSFVNSEGFGISRMVDFNRPEFRKLRVKDSDYHVAEMQLIGLSGDEPVVYTSNWMGMRRTNLDQMKTRPLASDERASLERLRVGADVTWTLSADHQEIKLIGSLRATKSCQQCHEVKANKLLGAFVYSLSAANSLHTMELSSTP
jgi:hypothetical protein